MPDLVGASLGPYHILEQIGLGGMATVYKAYQPGTDRLVALKVLPEHFAQDPRFVKRFEQEARVIAGLEHPNIVPVYGFGEEAGVAYLVMRYLQAGTAKTILAGGPLPLPDAARLLADVAAALDYAHSKGIIHRDVKPSNVLVDKQGAAYLTDFGIAKVVESTLDMTGSAALGTPAYMAPEQTLGKPVTPQSDIYSLGVMAYELVTGRPPFEADTPMAVALMHVHEPLPPPRSLRPGLPQAVEDVILSAVDKDPARRPQSAGELAHRFAGAVRESAHEAGDRPGRLTELAAAAAAELGAEEVTYDLRAELGRKQGARRLTAARRRLPLAAGIAAVLALSLAAVWFINQTSTLQSGALQTGTALAALDVEDTRAALTASAPPSATPPVHITETAQAAQTSDSATAAAQAAAQATAQLALTRTSSAITQSAFATYWSDNLTHAPTAVVIKPTQDLSWLANSNQANHVVFTAGGCTYLKLKAGPIVYHVRVELWDTPAAAKAGVLDSIPKLTGMGFVASHPALSLALATQNPATGKWGYNMVFSGDPLAAGTYDIAATGPGVDAHCTITVQP